MIKTVVKGGWLGTTTYWHPAIDVKFSSPLLNPVNLVAGEWEAAVRVAKRLKPVAAVDLPRRVQRTKVIARVRASGGTAVQEEDPEFQSLVTFMIDGFIGDTFDFDTLFEDYASWCSYIPSADLRRTVFKAIDAELDRIYPMQFSDFAHFDLIVPSGEGEWVRTGHRPSSYGSGAMAGERVRCGLLFGYPHTTTAAVVLGDVGVAGVGNDQEKAKARRS